MNWAAIGAIGEMIGAVGVILTLGYLAYQIRQNTRQLAQNERTAIATAVNASTINYRENRSYIYQSAEISAIMLKGLPDPERLDEVDLYRFRLIIHNLVDALLAMYSLTVVTGFSPETWQMLGLQLAERILTTPGGRWFWANFGNEYTGGFREEIERILRSASDDS